MPRMLARAAGRNERASPGGGDAWATRCAPAGRARPLKPRNEHGFERHCVCPSRGVDLPREVVDSDPLTGEVQPGAPGLAAVVAMSQGATLDGLALELAPGLVVRARQARAGEGATCDLSRLVARVPRLELLDVDVDVALDDLPKIAAVESLPLEALDAVNGRVSVDAVVGLVPAVPRVLNAIRLTLREGTLDWTELERGFHRLAGAVLHFRQRGSRLELEKDIPFVPWDESTLLAWRLDPDDRALARRHRIRLRRLLDVEVLEARRRDAGGAGCYGLSTLALDAIDVAVDLAPCTLPVLGGTAQLGLEREHGAEGVRLRGAIRCARGRQPAPTRVALGVRRASGVLRGLHVVGRRADVGRFTVEDVVGDVQLEGLTPRRLRVRAPKIVVEELSLS